MWTRELIAAKRWRLLLTALPLAVALVLGLWIRQVEVRNQVPLPVAPTLRYDAILASKDHPRVAALDIDNAAIPQPISLRRGQTLSGLLETLGLAGAEARGVLKAVREHIDVRRLRQGEIGLAYLDASANLTSLRLDVAGKGWVELAHNGSGWTSSMHRFVREVRLRRIEGELEDYLGNAIERAGGTLAVADRMSSVLQWDIDFNRDLRVGDRFRVLYEEIYLDGERVGPGEVLALAYDNRGQRYEAYRYGERGHYDAAGRPLQKMFLRSPLPFTRVTSRFSHSRFHPVLKVRRPHYGVDFGAPRGTPVRATANGTVTLAGRNGGAGKMVRVRHTNGYETSYLHLSGYAKGIRRGQRVAQGQVIGYVGSTGLATAPHLDYRVKKDGHWLDPLRLKSDSVEPVPRHEMAEFLARRDELIAVLEGGAGLPRVVPPLPRSSATLASRATERLPEGVAR